MRSRSFSSTSAPASSNTLFALGTASMRPNHGRIPSVRSTGSHATCARFVPPAPIVAPHSATARPPNTRGMSAGGRDSQSIAFLNGPGSELLYSGVTSSSAVRARDPLLQRAHGLGDAALRLDVAVVERDAADRRLFDHDRRRRELAQRAQERRVVRAAPQAARDAEDDRHAADVAGQP